MKQLFTFYFSFLFAFFVVTGGVCGQTASDLIITGVVDGPLSEGTPKAVEFYVANDISDLSRFGFGSANNGGGSDGQEFTFPAVSVTAGTFIYVSQEILNFNAFFGFNPDYTDYSALSINGDDAIELFFDGAVSDVFGDINTDGTGQPWEYLDGWAYRNDNTGPDGSTFVLGNWYFSGPNALDGETSNATAATPFPIGTFILPITLLSFEGAYRDGQVLLEWATAVEVNNDYMLVERSADGATYEAIGRVEGKGTTYVGHEYAFTDVNPLAGANYYRLCQVDFDGSKTYHQPIVVKTDGELSIFPTIVEKELYVQSADGYKNAKQWLQYRIFNLQGKELLQGALIPSASPQALPVSDLPQGMYVLRWQQGGASGVFRFVVKGGG